jgi:hypothetical protein
MQEKDMSITSPTRDRRSLAARLALVSTVSLGLVAGPVAFAGPASAAPSYNDKDNCSVKAHKPYKADYGKRDRDYGKFVKVVFKFTIDCKKRAHVKFDHKMFQHHGKWVKQIGDKKHSDWVYVKGAKDFKKVVKVKADRGEKDVKVSHTVTIKFLDKNKNKKWVWKTDYDRAKAVIELDKY